MFFGRNASLATKASEPATMKLPRPKVSGQLGYARVRCQDLMENTKRLNTLLGLTNLLTALFWLAA